MQGVCVKESKLYKLRPSCNLYSGTLNGMLCRAVIVNSDAKDGYGHYLIIIKSSFGLISLNVSTAPLKL